MVAVIGPWSWMTAWVPIIQCGATITIQEPVVPGSVTPALSGPHSSYPYSLAMAAISDMARTLWVSGDIVAWSAPATPLPPPELAVPPVCIIETGDLLRTSAPATRLPPTELAVPPIETGNLLRMSGSDSNILVMAAKTASASGPFGIRLLPLTPPELDNVPPVRLIETGNLLWTSGPESKILVMPACK